MTISSATVGAMNTLATRLSPEAPFDVSGLRREVDTYINSLKGDGVPTTKLEFLVALGNWDPTSHVSLWRQVQGGYSAYLQKNGFLPDKPHSDTSLETWKKDIRNKSQIFDPDLHFLSPKNRKDYWLKAWGDGNNQNLYTMARGGFYNNLRMGRLSYANALHPVLDSSVVYSSSGRPTFFHFFQRLPPLDPSFLLQKSNHAGSLRDWSLRVIEEWIRLTQPLAILHSKGILHRDISLKNFMKRPDGSYILVDLDTSIGVKELEELPARYVSQLCGTHCPPEMPSGVEVYSERYRPNFTDDTYAMSFVFCHIVDSLPTELCPIIEKARSPLLEGRYANAIQLYEALRQLRRKLKEEIPKT